MLDQIKSRGVVELVVSLNSPEEQYLPKKTHLLIACRRGGIAIEILYPRHMNNFDIISAAGKIPSPLGSLELDLGGSVYQEMM